MQATEKMCRMTMREESAGSGFIRVVVLGSIIILMILSAI
jgi:hypothetical protein